MQRHDLDVLSLVAGVVFAVLGGLFLADGLDALDLDVRWVAPILLIGLGVGGLASSMRSTGPDA